MLISSVGSTVVQAQTGRSLDPAKALTQYNLDGWTVDDGLSQSTITAIVQTRDGHLWIGTQEGVVQFDGIEFQVFDRGSGHLDNNVVTALLEDRAGALWIGTRGGGLTRMKDGHTTFTTADGLSSNEISTLLEDRHGTLWVGTYHAGINKLDVNGFSSLTQEQGLPTEKINTLYEDRDGALWIGTRGHGLLRFHEGQFTPFTTEDGLVGNPSSTGLTRTHEGLGLGLTIARQLTQRMGGTLTVESEPGRGSVFIVKFPTLRDEEVPSTPRDVLDKNRAG